MMLKKNVLMIVGSYLPLISGGGLQCKSIVDNLNKKINFTIFSTTHNYYNIKESDKDSEKIYRVNVNPINFISKYFALIKFTYLFLKIYKKIDIIHIHGLTSISYLFILLGRLFKKKIILKLSSFNFDDPITIKRKSFIFFLFIKKVEKLICISPSFKDSAIKSGFVNSQIELISNFVDINKFMPNNNKDLLNLKIKNNIIPNIPTLIFVGFFSKEKRPELVYKIWKKSFLQGYKSNLIFVGYTKGTYFEIKDNIYKKIILDIKQNNYSKYINFVEFTYNIEEYYNISDIFIFPSLREGVSNALLEAMSCKVTPVITKLPGISEFILKDGFNGYEFDASDYELFYKKLIKLLSSKESRQNMGEEARNLIVDEFNSSKILPKYLNLYENI